MTAELTDAGRAFIDRHLDGTPQPPERLKNPSDGPPGADVHREQAEMGASPDEPTAAPQPGDVEARLRVAAVPATNTGGRVSAALLLEAAGFIAAMKAANLSLQIEVTRARAWRDNAEQTILALEGRAPSRSRRIGEEIS